MGQARNRGTREERVAQAQAAGRRPGAPERTTPYAPRLVIRTSMLDYLWSKFKILGDVTVGEIRAQAVAEQQRLAAERAAQEQLNAATGNIERDTATDERESAGTGIQTSCEVVPDRIAAESGSAIAGAETA